MTAPPAATIAPQSSGAEARPGTEPSKRKGSGKSFDELLGHPEANPIPPSQVPSEPAPRAGETFPALEEGAAIQREALLSGEALPVGAPGFVPGADAVDAAVSPEALLGDGARLEDLTPLSGPSLSREAPPELPPFDSLPSGAEEPGANGTPLDVSGLMPSPARLEAMALPSGGEEPSSGPVERASLPELFNRLEALAQRGGGTVHLRLDPPELGRVEIAVLAKGSRIEIDMRSVSEAAKAALESGLNDLRSALKVQDLQLTRADVQVDQRLAGDQGEGPQARFDERPDGGRLARSRPAGARLAAVNPSTGPGGVMRPAGPGRLDVKV